MFRAGKDGVAGDFGAGAGGGRHGEVRQGRTVERLAAPDHFEVIEQLARLGGHRGDGFGGVDHAAAAEADEEIGFFRLGEGDAAEDVAGGRFATDRETRDFQTGFQEARENARVALRI